MNKNGRAPQVVLPFLFKPITTPFFMVLIRFDHDDISNLVCTWVNWVCFVVSGMSLRIYSCREFCSFA
ncbi:MAG: hypothetical protein C0616_02845 [Desulfuromonas sp.]|nr:MAG: hypothetical protein C0616_02845 [Desulfuromonas sp.]